MPGSSEPPTTQVAAPSGSLGGWRRIRRLRQGPWFVVDLAAPATCGPDWPADYVVKSVRPELLADSRPRAWLRREVEVSRQVLHPHLTTVLGAHLDHMPPFVVQPLYEGLTLREQLADGASLPIARALWIARQAAEALAALHGADWLHGDVKPDNIVVSPEGHVTLLDLGFAQRASHQGVTRLTNTLQATLAYAAPELFRDTAAPAPASDMYSLGICLYEMLTGQLPFAALSPRDLVHAHLHEEPAEVRVLEPRVPALAAQLLRNLLRKDSTTRPPAGEVVRQLVRCEIECLDLF